MRVFSGLKYLTLIGGGTSSWITYIRELITMFIELTIFSFKVDPISKYTFRHFGRNNKL